MTGGEWCRSAEVVGVAAGGGIHRPHQSAALAVGLLGGRHLLRLLHALSAALRRTLLVALLALLLERLAMQLAPLEETDLQPLPDVHAVVRPVLDGQAVLAHRVGELVRDVGDAVVGGEVVQGGLHLLGAHLAHLLLGELGEPELTRTTLALFAERQVFAGLCHNNILAQ